MNSPLADRINSSCRALANSLDKYTSGKWYWAIPVFCAVFLAIAAFAGNALYESNDDLGMIAILTGESGLRRSPDTIFLSPLLGHLLFGLYSLSEKIPWFGIVLYGVLASSYAIGLRTLLDSVSSIWSRLASTTAFTGFAWYLFFNINFGAVALLLWLILTTRLISQRNMPGWSPLYLSLVLGISPLIRPNMALIAAGITLPALLCLMLPQEWKKLLLFLLPATLIAAASLFWLSATTDPQLKEFNELRSNFFDLPAATYNEKTASALKNAGWSKEDYTLFNEVWIYDNTLFSTERIKKFIAANSPVPVRIYIERSFSYISKSGNYLILLVVAVTALLLNPGKISRPTRAGFAAILLTALAVIALIIIRFPLRVAVPTYAYLLILANVLILPSADEKRSRLKSLFSCTASMVVMFMLYRIIADISAENRLFTDLMYLRDKRFSSISRFVPPDTVFVAANLNALVIENGHPLRNVSSHNHGFQFPAGWLISSRHFETFLADHGFRQRPVVPSFIDNPKIYLYYFQSTQHPFPIYVNILLQHLTDHYARLFPGKKLKLEVLETPGQAYSDVMVFFKIITEQKGGLTQL